MAPWMLQSHADALGKMAQQGTSTSPRYGSSVQRFALSSYAPGSVTPSQDFSMPPARTSSLQHTPKGDFGKRHHRTATPEQRQIRDIMKAPVYTLGIDPQTDRGLLCDFFDTIKNWAATYTVNLRTLTAEQIHNLGAHPAISSILTQPSQAMMLVTEKDMLTAMTTSIISRYIFARTMSEHALVHSNHPDAHITSQLAYEWSILGANDPETKSSLLSAQCEIYTSIKNAADHKIWRATCAQFFTDNLITRLSFLLNTSLPRHTIKHRNHIMQELFVKGYRIGFRLRMSAERWDFLWPVNGVGFCAATMVNESRMLYGDVLRTMERVREEEGEHVVRFAVSPTVWKGDFGEVVYRGCVHVTRRGWGW